MNQRIVLWGALGALVVAAAGGAVVMAGGDDGGDGGPPRLPLALASSGEEAADDAAEPAGAAAVGMAPTTYVAGDGLPALGGDAPAYRLPVDVPSERVSELAGALGLSGEPESTGGGSWTLEDGDRRLDVYGPGNTWMSYTLVGPDTSVSSGPGAPAASDAPPVTDAPPPADGTGAGATGGGVSGNTGSGALERAAAPTTTTTIVCVMAPCEPPVEDPPLDPTGPATTIAAPTEPGSTEPGSTEPAPPTGPGVPTDVPPCVPGPAVLCPAGAPILDEPLPGLPTEDEATAIATELLESAGVDVGGARTTASGGIAEWYVEVEPTLGGVQAPGLSSAVTVGVDGVVVSASGPVSAPDELGDYALLTTDEAIDRLNEAGSVWAADAPGAAESGAESEPAPDAVSEPGVAAEAGAPTTGTSQPRGKRHQGGVPTRPPSGPPMTPGTALPPDPTVADPDGPATDLPATPTTVPRTTVPGDPGTPATEPAVPPPGDPDGPVEPAPMPAIVLTEAELVLIAVPSWDDTGSYLVPGYRFTDATGVQATVAAVVDDSLLPPE